MLNEARCPSQSAHFNEQAELCATPMFRDEYIALATGWRQTAAMAAYQVHFMLPSDPLNSNRHGSGHSTPKNVPQAELTAFL